MKTEHLWQKLALAFIGVAISAMVVAYLLINYVIAGSFQDYIDQRDKEVYRRTGISLAAAYIESGGWDNQLTASLPHFALMNKIDIEVHDARGRLITKAPFGPDDASNELVQKQIGNKVYVISKERRVVVPIIVRGLRVGFISVAPLIVAGEPTEQQKLRDSLNSALWVGGILATLVALALGYLVSIRMTRPLASMTRAAKFLGHGDLTQRVDVDREDEIGQLGVAFNHMAETLERQERMRKNMTADVAHELRTPLAVIRSHIEAYLDGVIQPDPANLQSIHEEIMRLGRLVDDLGALALAESGRLELERVNIDLADVVEDVAAALRPFFQEKEVELAVDVEAGTSGCFDAEKIRQVVVNLVGNAVKFTAGGGRVDVKVFNGADDTAVISVTDTGPGIDEHSLPHIFERFYRTDKSRNRETGGSGIGLTIVKELVKLHGGAVTVESRPGEGSRFTVVLPKDYKKMKIHNPHTRSS